MSVMLYSDMFRLGVIIIRLYQNHIEMYKVTAHLGSQRSYMGVTVMLFSIWLKT